MVYEKEKEIKNGKDMCSVSYSWFCSCFLEVQLTQYFQKHGLKGNGDVKLLDRMSSYPFF